MKKQIIAVISAAVVLSGTAGIISACTSTLFPTNGLPARPSIGMRRRANTETK